MKKLLIIIIGVLLSFIPNIVVADEQYYKTSNTNTYGNGEYALTKYDVNITVNEDNTFDIVENIDAYFNIYKHGIYRTIPLKNTIYRTDGTTSNNRARITNLYVDNKYTTSTANDLYTVKIGSASLTLIGDQSYKIGYTYNIGKDPSKEFDEFYFNIIGDEWDTTISNISFMITMPKEFDPNKLGFSSEKNGSTKSDDIDYTVDGNVITGTYNGTLDAGEALTVRLTLDEGYFVGAGFKISSSTYMLFITPILSLLISILFWFKFGRDALVIDTVEFYPPAGFNSLEVGYLYNGVAGKKDVVSLLVYLASKGYIKILETEEKSLFSVSKGFKIIKIKEYDGNNVNERLFLDDLFKKRTILDAIANIVNPSSNEEIEQQNKGEQTEEVTNDDLYNSFYITMDRILSNINNKKNKYKLFEKTTSGKSVTIISLIVISLLTMIIIPTLEYETIDKAGVTLFLILFYIPFYSVIFIKKVPIIFRLFWGGFTVFHSFMFFSSMPIATAIKSDATYLVSTIVGVACILGMIICLKLMPRRTNYGKEILGKLKGFKNFLETAEKGELENKVLDDPSYFYNILPFAYVLGVSDLWIKKFESIALQAPDWYSNSEPFSVSTFGSFMNNTISLAEKSLASFRSTGSDSGFSSFDSGSSGGGSSGGGSGGGGGGSW